MARPITDEAIRKLSPNQRSLLIDHIDGEIQIAGAHQIKARNSLMQAGLLRGPNHQINRPRTTVLTEAGRRAVGVILGDYADGLVRAGLLEQTNPLAVLRRLKTLGGFPGKRAPAPADTGTEPLKPG